MPIWRRLLRLHLDHPNPEVAQQAAAALADLESEADTDWTIHHVTRYLDCCCGCWQVKRSLCGASWRGFTSTTPTLQWHNRRLQQWQTVTRSQIQGCSQLRTASQMQPPRMAVTRQQHTQVGVLWPWVRVWGPRRWREAARGA